MTNPLELPDYVPYTDTAPRVEVPYEAVRWIVDQIADEIWTLSLPTSNLSDVHRRDAYKWSDSIRNHSATCCSIHLVEQMAALLKTIEFTLRHCTDNSCTEDGNHDFLVRVGIVIDTRMDRFLKSLAAKAEVRGRVN